MKYGVDRNVLLVTAGVVWIVAGINILRIGVSSWREDHGGEEIFRVGEATAVFLLFFVFVFRRLYYKHTRRIEAKKGKGNCPFSFFDAKGWGIMVLMVAFGITVRVCGLLPDRFISVFYTGLSLALIATGLLFIRYWKKQRDAPKV